MQIAHLVNIFTIEERHKASYLHVAMPVTLHAMYNAAEFARLDNIDVQLYACKYKDDNVERPAGFSMTSPLTSLYENKFPYISEIFSKFDEIHADYYIYSNIDVTPERNFYSEIAELLGKKSAPISILRNDVDYNYWITKKSNKIIKHPGHDCFVFSRETQKQIILPEKVFLGFPPVGSVIYDELRRISGDIISLRDITYHLGSDRPWENSPLTHVNRIYSNNIAFPS